MSKIRSYASSIFVMAGLDPAIHVIAGADFEMDGRHGGRP
jgi:hypothetical protein